MTDDEVLDYARADSFELIERMSAGQWAIGWARGDDERWPCFLEERQAVFVDARPALAGTRVRLSTPPVRQIFVGRSGLRFSWAVSYRATTMVANGVLAVLAFSQGTQGWEFVGAVLAGFGSRTRSCSPSWRGSAGATVASGRSRRKP